MLITEENGFRYYEKGTGGAFLVVHGLFGTLSNFKDVIEHFSKRMQGCIPLLPLYNLPADDTSVEGMVHYLEKFVEHKKYDKVILLGNSLGGHIALMYTM